MKKIGIILLTIYVTITTIGCALFGYLYFANKSNPSTPTLSRAEATTLVNQVYRERNLGTRAAAAALDYEDFQGDTVDESKLTIPYLHDASLILTKTLLESDLLENTWYKSENLAFHGFIRFYMRGQSVFFENTDKLENQMPEDADKYQHISIFNVTKVNENAWTSALFYQTLTTVQENGCCAMSYLHFKSENKKIYEVHQDYFDSSHKSVFTENVTDLDEIVNVSVYDCNTKTHKVLDRTGTKASQLTDDEKLKIVNDMIDTAQQICEVRTEDDFGETTNVPNEIFDDVTEYIRQQVYHN